MPAPELLGYQDLIQRLQAYSQGGAGDAQMADIRQAIHSAYREVIGCHDWKYFQVRGRIVLAAAYDTGTIVYDHTGGTYERQVTLSGGTFPDWARYGRLKISTDLYEVAERKTSTVLTLKSDSNPGADVSSTAYTLYRNAYTLPGDMVTITRFQSDDGPWDLQRIDPVEFMQLEKRWQAASTPYCYSIMGSPDALGSFAIHFYPYPTAAENIDFIYRRRGRQLRYTGFGTADRSGTVSGTAGFTSISATSGAFTSAMVGSLIRFGDTTNHPDGLPGLNPYVEQKVIAAVTDANSLTTDTALDSTYTNVKYVITDPVDVDPALIEPLYACAQKHLTSFRRPERMATSVALYRESLIQAMEEDSRFAAEWPSTIWWHDPYGGSTVAAGV